MSKPREVMETYDVLKPDQVAFQADGQARREALEEWFEQSPFSDASKVLAYDVLLCRSGRLRLRSPGIFLPTPPNVLPKDITRLAVFSYPDLTPLTYFGDLRPGEGEHYGGTSLLEAQDFDGQGGRDGRSLMRVERSDWYMDGPTEIKHMPGEDGLGLEIWDDRNWNRLQH